jgi:threonylcarbamoyladenosine tRNA methylthiotransferase MtaB
LKKLKIILQDMQNKKVSTYLQACVIVGFPGETTEDFYSTVEFLCDTNFDFIAVLGFSPREGTPATKFRHQLSQRQIEMREKIMRQYLNVFRAKQLLQRIARIASEIKNKTTN